MKNADAGEVGRETSEVGPPTSSLRISASLWSSEGIQGVCHNELTPPLVRRFAGAFAAQLFDQLSDVGANPTVIVANDGRSLAAELFSAAAEGARWAGCHVIEIGDVPLGAVCFALQKFAADGAIYTGNAPSEPRTIGIKLQGVEGRPWSLGGTLDCVREHFEQGFARPRRVAGSVQRQSIDGVYRDALARMFHALRPLTFVLDTTCAPLLRWLREFLATSGCRMIRPEPLPVLQSVHGKSSSSKLSFCERRYQMVARQVVASAADFGVWIDGDGESCRWFDEQGRVIELLHLMTAFAKRSEHNVNLSQVSVEPTRETAANRVINGPAIAGTEAGSIWFRLADRFPQSDALVSLGALLNLLSESDTPPSRMFHVAVE